MIAYISTVPSVIDQVDHHNMVVWIVAAIYLFKVRWVGVALAEPDQDENKDDTCTIVALYKRTTTKITSETPEVHSDNKIVNQYSTFNISIG